MMYKRENDDMKKNLVMRKIKSETNLGHDGKRGHIVADVCASQIPLRFVVPEKEKKEYIIF